MGSSTQVAPTQIPDSQTLPQLPQCSGSLDVSTQLPPQSMRGGGQSSRHSKSTQNCPGAQPIRHPPQCLGSMSTRTHSPPQNRNPIGHSSSGTPASPRPVSPPPSAPPSVGTTQRPAMHISPSVG